MRRTATKKKRGHQKCSVLAERVKRPLNFGLRLASFKNFTFYSPESFQDSLRVQLHSVWLLGDQDRVTELPLLNGIGCGFGEPLCFAQIEAADL
jgi:hypothetical protein